MISKFLLFLICLTNYSFAQIEEFTEVDSLRLQHKYNTLLNSTNKFEIPLSLLANPSIFQFDEIYSNQDLVQLSHLNSFAMARIKNNINQSFSIYRKGQNKYHLGVISDVLGYVSTAAAFGLAAYHVYKYRKKYGIK